MELKVYVANLGRYNEGELVGSWFTPPIDEEEMAERIGLNENYEEYAIHDFELPFDVDEYTPISEINRLCEAIQEIEGTPIYNELKEIQGMWFSLVAWKNYWKTKRIFIVIVNVILWKMSPVIMWKKQDNLVKYLLIYKIILIIKLWDVIWK